MNDPRSLPSPPLTLLTDLYQLTMAAAYWRQGLAERRAAALALDRDLLRDLLGADELRAVEKAQGTPVGRGDVVILHTGWQALAGPGPGSPTRGGRQVPALDQPGADRTDALLLELVERAQVHLGGVDQVAHESLLHVGRRRRR